MATLPARLPAHRPDRVRLPGAPERPYRPATAGLAGEELDFGASHPLGPFTTYLVTGLQIWRIDDDGSGQLIVPAAEMESARGPGAAIRNGIVFGNFANQRVLGFDSTGTEVFTSLNDTPAGASRYVVASRDGHLFLNDDASGADGGNTKFASDGSIVWHSRGRQSIGQFDVNWWGESSIQNHVLGDVKLLSPAGDVVWALFPFGSSGAPRSSAFDADGDLYVGAAAGKVGKFARLDGAEEWLVTLAGVTGEVRSLALGDDSLVAGTTGGELLRLNPETGTVVWQLDLGSSVHSVAVDPLGYVYAVAGLTARKFTSDGQEVWSFVPTGSSGSALPSVVMMPGRIGPGLWGTTPSGARTTEDHEAALDPHDGYVKADGSRAFAAEVAGVTPVTDDGLATKAYVDGVVDQSEVTLVSPDGTRWTLVVDDAGTVSASEEDIGGDPGGGDVTFVAASSPAYSSSASSISPVAPSDVAAGDALLVALFHRSGESGTSAPSGFTRVAQAMAADGSFSQWTELWAKVADGSEASANQTFTFSSSGRVAAVALVARSSTGAIVFGPAGTDGIESSGNPGLETFATISSAPPGSLAVALNSCVYAGTGGASVTYVAPSGWSLHTPETDVENRLAVATLPVDAGVAGDRFEHGTSSHTSGSISVALSPG